LRNLGCSRNDLNNCRYTAENIDLVLLDYAKRITCIPLVLGNDAHPVQGVVIQTAQTSNVKEREKSKVQLFVLFAGAAGLGTTPAIFPASATLNLLFHIFVM
jgi:hypothetical protein